MKIENTTVQIIATIIATRVLYTKLETIIWQSLNYYFSELFFMLSTHLNQTFINRMMYLANNLKKAIYKTPKYSLIL